MIMCYHGDGAMSHGDGLRVTSWEALTLNVRLGSGEEGSFIK